MPTTGQTPRPDLASVARAIELSASVVVERPDLLAGQVVGRLFDVPGCAALRHDARASGTTHWLCPASSGLRGPSSPVLRTIATAPSVLALAPDGRTLLTGNADGTTRAWDLAGGGPPVVLVPDSGPLLRTVGSQLGVDGRTPEAITERAAVTSIVFVGRTGRVAVGHADDDDTVVVHHAASGAVEEVLRGRLADSHGSAHEARGIAALAVTPDGRELLTLAEDGTVRAWTPGAGTGPREVVRVGGGRTLAVHPDGRRLVIGSVPWPRPRDDETDLPRGILVVDRFTGAVLHVGPDLAAKAGEGPGPAMPRAPACLAVSPDGQCVVAGFGDDHDTAVVWAVGDQSSDGVSRRAASPAARGAMESRGIEAVAVTPDGQAFVTGHNDGRIMVWPLHGDGDPVGLRGHTGPVRDVCVTGDGSRLISCSDDGVVIWNLQAASGDPWIPATLRSPRALTGAAVCPDGSSAVAGSLHGEVLRWRRGDRWRRLTRQPLPVTGVDLSTDGTRVAAALDASGASLGATGDSPRCLRAWDLDPEGELAGQRGAWSLRGVHLTRDGRWAFAVRRDLGVQLVRMATDGSAPARSVDLAGDAWSVAAVADDGSRALVANWQTGEVTELRLSGHRLLPRRRTPPGRLHTGGSIDLVVAALETGRVASVGADQALRVHDLSRDRLVHRLATRGRPATGPEGARGLDEPWVNALAMSDDGRWAITGTSNGWLELWELHEGRLLADFKLEAPVLAVAVEANGPAVAALDAAGTVLRLVVRAPRRPTPPTTAP